MNFRNNLESELEGEVRFDSISKSVYSVDASIYEVEPICIVLPKNKSDILKAIKIAAKHEVPIIARGAGTGIVGGCIGKGMIIDTSKYLNNILQINFEEEYAIVEPGVVQDQLNEALSNRGYRLGPNTSTGNRATIGGMVANNSAGSHSLIYGKMVDHVLEVELALSTGELIRFSTATNEGKIYDTVQEIRKEYQKDIEKHFPKIPRRVSGYNLDELIKDEPLNICKLIVGSEGSFGIATEIKVRITKKKEGTGLILLHFNNMIEGLKKIEEILSYFPYAVEMIDDKIIEMSKKSPQVKDNLNWLQGSPECVFAVELPLEKLSSFPSLSDAQIILTDPISIAKVWEVRKLGLGLLLSKRTYKRAVAFIEDISLPPQNLASFMEKFRAYLKENGKEAGIYGHAASGAMHLRPYMDLRDPTDLKLMEKIMIDVADQILEYGGALSGEHGDGMLRSWLNKKMFGERIYEAFLKLKNAFDPKNLMNPGKVVNGQGPLENLRAAPKLPLLEISTFLDFSKEGGFSLSADMCNGNGLCRKKSTLMCPSFQATQDEYDTTRARAQVLRDIIHTRLPPEELTGEGLQEILDLCIECKGCKKECPSQVDMAKMKAETLFQHQEIHGYSFRNRLFAHFSILNKWVPFFLYPLANYFKGIIGISKFRSLPKRAKRRFSQINQKSTHYEKTVVLFNDTYTEFNHPEIGESAIKILNALGYNVIIPSWNCCGRPFISKGFLKQAKNQAEKVINALHPYIQYPIIFLEPSCFSALIDDYRGLLGYSHKKLIEVIRSCTSLDQFLENKMGNLSFTKNKQVIKIHGHCHQKALIGSTPTLNVLKSIPGFEVSEIPSGCCGMAGSFGYEKEHYTISQKIGELQLFPAIRENQDAIIIASGFSCRTQIQDGTQRKAFHIAEAIANKILTTDF